MKNIRLSLLLLFVAVFISYPLDAQYFGKNKVGYEDFDFQVLETPNFEIYHYLENKNILHDLANHAEHWYKLHQAILLDTFTKKNPLIFYNNHADFQQTNAIMGSVGVGTGGVTEALKNRVILPIAYSNQQTDHVLGHEMVHAFQYNLILNGDSTSMRNLANLPLWLVEGLAEYLSIGSVDAHTAMWMRDAVLNDDVPSIKDLNKPKYFPYRYGQAFWVFLTGLKGDEIIEPFFMATAKYGFEIACEGILGMSMKNLSSLWEEGLKKYFGDFLNYDKEQFIGKKLIHSGNAGRLNISPVLSPNGLHVIFLSEKDLFSTDLYLADARSGEIMRKVASAAKSGHIDDFDYIESAGTWSPNSKQFAFVAFSKGQNLLIIKDVTTGNTVDEVFIEGVSSFTNPAWSPSGRVIAFTGLVDGQTDLYLYNIRSKKVEKITNDRYAELQANWSSDGSKLAFATDRLSMTRPRVNGKWTFNLAIMDVESREISNIDVFPGADNLNPVFDNKDDLLFLSNRDGYRNMYRYDTDSSKVYQLTDFLTGVSGITQYAPAITATRSERRDRVLFTHYFKNGYSIYQAQPKDFLNKEVDPTDVDMTAATLLIVNRKATRLVDANLNKMDHLPTIAATEFKEIPYKPKFRLDYLGGGAGAGVGTSNAFGTTTGMAGSVDLLFTDILGNNMLYTGIAMNGEIYDFGGIVQYVNQKNRIGWGGSISHVPYRSGAYEYVGFDTIPNTGGIGADRWNLYNQRLFEDRAGVFAQFPFSRIQRFEIGASYSRYYYRNDLWKNYYDQWGRLLWQDREKLDAPPGFNLWNINAAFVGDNSVFGLTSPLKGYRYRVSAEKYFGEYKFTSLTADARGYKYVKPVSFAARVMHYGRYGKGGNDLYPLYLGSSWYVRGYDYSSATEILQQNGRSVNDLLGSKLLISSFEVRLPLSGPERLALFKSGFLFTDLALFVDGGLSWNYDFFRKEDSENLNDFSFDKAVFSAGVSLRINLFGAMILEPYYAYPLMKESKGVFGLNIIPGW